MQHADLLVLGGGIAGHACARASAELGARVVLVDGGDWRSSRSFRSVLPQGLLASLIGKAPAGADGAALFGAFQEQRDRLIAAEIEGLGRGLADLGVERVAGEGVLASVGPTIRVETPAGAIDCERLVLAVGARTGRPAWAGPGTPVVPADDLYLDDGPLPRQLAVLGANYIGVAKALLFGALGADVVVVFEEDEPLAGFDDAFRRHVGSELVRRGVRLRPGTSVRAVTRGAQRHAVETTADIITADVVALAAGGAPVPNTEALRLDRFGIACTATGAVFVDARYETGVRGVFAIGDCADHAGQGLDPATYDLGPVADVEGRHVAAHLFGDGAMPVDYDLIPLALAGPLPLGMLGLGTERARALGFDVQARGGPLAEDGRFARLVADRSTGRVIGCQLAGPGADGLIRQVASLLAADAALGAFAAALAAETSPPSTLVEELVAHARSLG